MKKMMTFLSLLAFFNPSLVAEGDHGPGNNRILATEARLNCLKASLDKVLPSDYSLVPNSILLGRATESAINPLKIIARNNPLDYYETDYDLAQFNVTDGAGQNFKAQIYLYSIPNDQKIVPRNNTSTVVVNARDGRMFTCTLYRSFLPPSGSHKTVEDVKVSDLGITLTDTPLVMVEWALELDDKGELLHLDQKRAEKRCDQKNMRLPTREEIQEKIDAGVDFLKETNQFWSYDLDFTIGRYNVTRAYAYSDDKGGSIVNVHRSWEFPVRCVDKKASDKPRPIHFP